MLANDLIDKTIAILLMVSGEPGRFGVIDGVIRQRGNGLYIDRGPLQTPLMLDPDDLDHFFQINERALAMLRGLRVADIVLPLTVRRLPPGVPPLHLGAPARPSTN